MAEIKLSYERMKEMQPEYWYEYEEMQELLKALGVEIDDANTEGELVLTDAFIMTMEEDRVEEWEKWLGLPPNGTLEERRLAILDYFMVIAKLTRDAIKAIVSASCDGARAEVVFKESTIRVEIKPLPEHDIEEVNMDKVYRQLYTRKPCHISLTLTRFYCTWGDVKNGFNTWQALKDDRPTWNAVKLFILD